MPRALLSVSDKSGLLEFGVSLIELGWTLIASGGTARVLREMELPVDSVEDLTGAPEMLGGRVKTLHPAIHAGILARSGDEDAAELAQHNIQPIDMVVCNLYPFQETVADPATALSDAVEQIDIGGVTLLRSAAKNFQRVVVVCDPEDYQPILAELWETGRVTDLTRRRMAVKAFAHTRDYDTAIEGYLRREFAAEDQPDLPPSLSVSLPLIERMRYGENPHQPAGLYARPGSGPLGGELLAGKALSYNNMLDLNAAWQTCLSFHEPVAVIVKHLSPCGIACAQDLPAAFGAALASDPVSAFGGVIAVNRFFDLATVQALGDLFVEAIAAPEFEPEAIEFLAGRKPNCRLIRITNPESERWELRSVAGGILVQSIDRGDPDDVRWEPVTRRKATPKEREDLQMAWLACQHVRSNAIVLAQDGATVGIGGGLPSRVDAVRLAVSKAGERARGAVLASDAFFPFPDGVEIAAQAGVTAIVQPGGSVRDEKVIAMADSLDVAMLFTGVRHFRH